jgi:hypothetical protein
MLWVSARFGVSVVRRRGVSGVSGGGEYKKGGRGEEIFPRSPRGARTSTAGENAYPASQRRFPFFSAKPNLPKFKPAPFVSFVFESKKEGRKKKREGVKKVLLT